MEALNVVGLVLGGVVVGFGFGKMAAKNYYRDLISQFQVEIDNMKTNDFMLNHELEIQARIIDKLRQRDLRQSLNIVYEYEDNECNDELIDDEPLNMNTEFYSDGLEKTEIIHHGVMSYERFV